MAARKWQVLHLIIAGGIAISAMVFFALLPPQAGLLRAVVLASVLLYAALSVLSIISTLQNWTERVVIFSAKLMVGMVLFAILITLSSPLILDGGEKNSVVLLFYLILLAISIGMVSLILHIVGYLKHRRTNHPRSPIPSSAQLR